MINGHHQQTLVQIAGQNMRLLGKIRGTPYDIIPAFLYVCYVCRLAFTCRSILHVVTYGYGICAFYAFDAESTLYTAFLVTSVISPDQIAAAGITNN
jgi:hypothetical protein